MGTYVIFGAAVKPGGIPSGSLSRRIKAAIDASNGDDKGIFICSGGLGKYPPTEARVMQGELREEGVGADRILLDEKSMDTLDTIINCRKIIRENDLSDVVVCTDRYHQARCMILFRLAGIRTSKARVAPSRKPLGTKKWIWYNIKELIATPYDALLLVFRA